MWKRESREWRNESKRKKIAREPLIEWVYERKPRSIYRLWGMYIKIPWQIIKSIKYYILYS